MHERLQALLDRRDIAQEQYRSPEPTPVTPHVIVPDKNSDKILQQLKTLPGQLVVTDRETPQTRMENFPINGVCRYILRRTGDGGTYTVLQNAPLLIAEAKEFRLGLEIVNISAANLVTLFFTEDLITPGTTTPLTAATPQLGLPADARGIWHGMLSNVVWAGNVIALCTATGGATVTVADI